MDHQEYIDANDGCCLAIKTSIPFNGHGPYQNKAIILLHGFAGSSEYFCRNFDQLSDDQNLWVIAPDMRGHGDSGTSQGGYHVARLAMDLKNLITHLRNVFNAHKNTPGEELQIVAVGCSIGAAILWTYVELFTCADFAGLVFVDQAPLQDAVFFGQNHPDNWDATHHHKGCFNEATLQAAQRAWISQDRVNTCLALVNECLGYRQNSPLKEIPAKDEDEDFWHFCRIAQQCDGRWLARLMADHTRYDHREAIERIDVPVLVMAGALSGCFPLDGMWETVTRIQASARDEEDAEVDVSVFEGAGHWLFYENPNRFNLEIIEFVYKCTD
ncbi:Alpha/Beta hydrolase protein [Rhypophila decipiens]|uniref:Alpha/Beta hydrolase protein n=1 Tax=Rhypophila decipiens TaxID=261697 RepID=A0AAN6YDD6_9PEZI|nr:Alpha/Beta hydrolase protein [Rhypophila decipiens]